MITVKDLRALAYHHAVRSEATTKFAADLKDTGDVEAAMRLSNEAHWHRSSSEGLTQLADAFETLAPLNQQPAIK